MPKNICIFSDGTGQMGGLRPDQRLSNIYKMYRAMRPGPDSPIDPAQQVAYYSPGLGSGERPGLLGQIQAILSRAVGTGIDHNITDCYEQIIAFYEPGDCVLLFGFSRGAYTVRALANVMNLCGVPTRMPDGSPVPRHGAPLRKIAEDAVKYVYSHGAGRPRGQEPFFSNREELGRRFRARYGSAPATGPDVQGNVQPSFIGVFDTVASLQTVKYRSLVWGVTLAVWVLVAAAAWWDWSAWIAVPLVVLAVVLSWQLGRLMVEAFKFFSPDPNRRLHLTNPADWPEIAKTGHFAGWENRNYDRWLDPDVGHARHAMAIDEDRADFPRVLWGSASAMAETQGRKPEWLRQVWFAGCHSDIGGSYPEPESRLSDIALDWMVDELRDCVTTVHINDGMLNRWPDPRGLQHRQDAMFSLWSHVFPWRKKPREVQPDAPLHPSVLVRLEAGPVPQHDEVKPYRPEQLRGHAQTARFYDGAPVAPSGPLVG